jgi:pilus assembly protein CpaE
MSNLAFDDATAPAPEAPPATEARTPEASNVRPVPRISIQAFCETPELAATIETAASDRRMGRAHLKVHMGGISSAIEFYGSAPTPNLIMVESRQPAERLMEELDKLSAVCDPGSKVVVFGHVNDVALYRALGRRGISEYLVTPVSEVQIIKTVADLYVEPGVDRGGPSPLSAARRRLVHGGAQRCSIVRPPPTTSCLADLDLALKRRAHQSGSDTGIADAVNAPSRVDRLSSTLLARCRTI